MDFSFRRATTFFALGALLALPACDRNDPDDHEDLHAIQVIDRGASGQPTVATWELGVGWEGAIPPQNLAEQERLSLGIRAYDDHGDEITLSETGEFFIQYFVSEDPDDVINTGFPDATLYHGDHVHVYGQAVGTAQIVFELWHVDHVDRATDPITYTVIEEETEAGLH